MKLKLKEPLGQRISLQAVIDVNTAMNSILKESYRNLSGKKPRSKSPELQIYIGDLEKGSIIEELFLEVQKDPKLVGQLAFEAFNIGPKHVFEVTREAFKFLMEYAKLKKEGQTVHVHIAENSNAVVNVGNNITVSNVVFNTATAITKSGEQLTRAVKNESLEFLEISEVGFESIKFDKSNYDCFESVIDIDEDVRIIEGNIVSFNKEKGTGTVKFFQDMEEISLKFKLSGKKFLFDTIDSMKEKRCKLYCHEEFVLGPNGLKSVVGLEVFKIVKSETSKNKSEILIEN